MTYCVLYLYVFVDYNMYMSNTKYKKQISIFNKNNGLMKTSDAIDAGINPWDLYAMVDEGIINRESRGLYLINSMEEIGNPDFTILFNRAPKAILFLLSALEFHHITTQIPRKIYIALPKGWKKPKIDEVPLDVFFLSNHLYDLGIEKCFLNNQTIKVYDIEKTIVDCFRFRNRIGLDIALEALKDSWNQKRINLNKIHTYSKICRMKNVMSPYLESIINTHE